MTMTPVSLKLEEKTLVAAVQDARTNLDGAASELLLDFYGVRRLDASMLKALEDLATTAHEKSATITLSGVDVQVYRVLVLAKLASRFSYVN